MGAALLRRPISERAWERRHAWGAKRVQNMLFDLHGFYVKVGQVFATKADLLPPAYIPALKSTLDACPESSFGRVRRMLERELGKKLEDVFESVEHKPLAAATVAQVHRATMLDGRQVAVKVQHQGVERLMLSDIGNMLFVSETLEHMGLRLNFDHVSILHEYRKQVPVEFDFAREVEMMDTAAVALQKCSTDRVIVPAPLKEFCTNKVIVMDYIEGAPLSKHLAAVAAAKATTDGAYSVPAGVASSYESLRGDEDVVRPLLEAFGHMIFREGKFHADPHPGNLLVLPDKRLGLIDFGLFKSLDDELRIKFAKLTVALAQRNPIEILPLLSDVGIELANVTPEFGAIAAYILFDTRMDIEEARMNPLEAGAEDMRAAEINKLPEDLFMLVRVVALVRGILAGFDADVSAALVWEPYARAALAEAGVEPPAPPAETPPAAGVGAAPAKADDITSRMTRLAEFFEPHGLPAGRRELTPLALAGCTTFKTIAEADETKLEKAFKSFTAEQKEMALQLSKEEAAKEEAEEAEEAARAAAASVTAAAAEAAASPEPAPAKKGGCLPCLA